MQGLGWAVKEPEITHRVFLDVDMDDQRLGIQISVSTSINLIMGMGKII